jgi:hypothetical protein
VKALVPRCLRQSEDGSLRFSDVNARDDAKSQPVGSQRVRLLSLTIFRSFGNGSDLLSIPRALIGYLVSKHSKTLAC